MSLVAFCAGSERKIRSTGPTDSSFGLLLHVCCTQRGFQLAPGVELRHCSPDRGTVGASSSPPPKIQCSLPERQISARSAGREHYMLWFVVGDTGIEPVASSVSRKRSPTELIALVGVGCVG
jgi:hypothetical protein